VKSVIKGFRGGSITGRKKEKKREKERKREKK
jgi:hypothetical protein